MEVNMAGREQISAGKFMQGRIGFSRENHCTAHHLQYLHDVRLVWTSQVQGLAVMDGDSGELADRIFRVLLSSTGQSHRLRPVFNRPVKNYTGSDHTGRFRS